MSQKSNLITIRKKNKIELISQNTKIWSSLYFLIENMSRLFYLKGVWILKSFCAFDTNLVSLNLFLYYKKAKLSIYKKKIIKKKNIMNVYIKNKLFSTLFYNYINILGYNFFDFNILNLNFYIDKKKLVFI